MSRRAVRAGAATADAAAGLAAIRAELGIPAAYDPQVLAEAEAAAADGPHDDGRDRPRIDREDARDIPLVTLDPPGSMDLDQAFHLARLTDGRGTTTGYVVHYAIADVASFLTPGAALAASTHERGVTYYGPDGRFGLHPPVLSEGAASLLPDQDRPAVLWRIRLDSDGVIADIDVRRAWVRSRAQLTYPGVQHAIDVGTADEMLALLPEIGTKRTDLQIARGGASLDVPEQEVTLDGGRYRLSYRAPLAVEEHNSQLSLLTGMAAARLQREAGIGLWRTLRPAREEDVARLRRVALGLGLAWPAGEAYGAFARRLDTTKAIHAAVATEATALFRGAAYVAFGTPTLPGVPTGAVHTAIAAEYAHVTAPLRRLVDRFGTEIALAHVAGVEVPQWVHEHLDELPHEMSRATQRASAYERESLDLLEALILAKRVGRTYEAVVVEASPDKKNDDAARATVLLDRPAVRARVTGPASALRLASRVWVRVAGADVEARTVALELVDGDCDGDGDG